MDIPYRYTENTSSFAYYWQHGTGVNLLAQLPKKPDLMKAREFIPLFYEWDLIGDQLVLDVFLKHGFKKADDKLQDFIANPTSYPQKDNPFSTFFDTFDLEPDWLDWNRLAIGQEFCQRPGLTSMIVLRDYCLMGGYESAAINKPLIYTGALSKGAVKRLVDTVEFWVQITKPGNLSWGKAGFVELIRTRLIHSYARVNILDKTDWDTKKWGIPINIWDMLATNLGFSLVFLVGLRLMGIRPNKLEVDGLFHFWKYIGYILGIPVHLLPNNEEEAIEALYYWTMTQRDGDDDSKKLAKALQEQPVLAKYPKSGLMRQMMREIHLFYNHYLLGGYSCELLGLEKTTIGRFAITHIWKTKRQENQMHYDDYRMRAVEKGAAEQEHIRNIYETYNTR